MAFDAISAIVGFITFYAVYRVTVWTYATYQIHQLFQKYGIPGPKPEFFKGNTRSFETSPTFVGVISAWIKKYGNVFGYFLGNLPVIMINDPDILKEVFVKQWHKFVNRPENLVEVYPLQHGILQLKDQRWKEVRRVLSPIFHDKGINIISHKINEKVDTVLEIVAEKAQRGEEFDMYKLSKLYVFETLAECLLGMKPSCIKNPHNDIFILTEKLYDLIDTKIICLVFAYSNIFDIFRLVNRYIAVRRTISSIVKILKKQIKAQGDCPRAEMNVLRLLMDTHKDYSSKDDGSSKITPFTSEEIVANIFSLLMAGFETSSSATGFTFHLLCQYQDDQEKLYDEISKSSLTDPTQVYESVQSMKYLDAIWSESLRIFPPIVKGTGRQCNETCTVGKYTITKGTIVQAATWDIHHDPQFWEDPWKFKPERFYNGFQDRTKNAYIPGGLGPRSCIAIRFGSFISKLLIARLIKEFRFVACDKTIDPVQFNDLSLTLHPAAGVYVKAIPRKK